MNDLNQCIFTGRLTRDPELRRTATGKAITSASLAVNRSWKNADGDWCNKTTYIDLNLWNGQGEALAKIGRKGDLLSVVAEFELQEWDDKTTGEKRRSPRFNVTSWNKLAGSNKGESSKAEELDSDTSPQNTPTPEEDTEDIPF